MFLCVPGFLVAIVALHVYALVACRDASAQSAIARVVASLVLMLGSFAVPLFGPSGADGIGWVGASMLLFAVAAAAIAGDGARRTSGLAHKARGELDRGEGMRRASSALLAVACMNLVFVAIGGLVLALTLTGDFP